MQIQLQQLKLETQLSIVDGFRFGENQERFVLQQLRVLKGVIFLQ